MYKLWTALERQQSTTTFNPAMDIRRPRLLLKQASAGAQGPLRARDDLGVGLSLSRTRSREYEKRQAVWFSTSVVRHWLM